MAEKKFGIKTQGTVANNRPVGSAGQPQGKIGNKKDNRAGAIQRRIDNMNKKNGKGGY